MSGLSRRRFVFQVVAGAVAATGLAACARRAEPPAAASATAAPATAAPASAGATTAPVAAAAPTSAPAAAAARPTSVPAGQPKRGGSITVGVTNDWITLDPAYNNADNSPQRMLYDPLLYYKADSSGAWNF